MKTRTSRDRGEGETANLGPRRASAETAAPTFPEPERRPPKVSNFPEVSRGNYQRGEEFARGGLGTISKALDRRLDRIVALKELHVAKPAIEARFAREIQITARLQHPNIVPVHEAGRWPSGEPFFAMKLVDGRSLADVIKLKRTLQERLGLLNNVIAVADAMAYAHTEGVIHRDLKPHNVLLGPFGETVVIDWGLAKDLRATEEDDTATYAAPQTDGYATTDGAVMGTPAYMPPEQALGEPVDERADVYSLGAILYHVLAGMAPYVREGIGDVIERVREGPPTPVRVIEPEAPAELVAIVGKAMAHRQAERYRTAREMAEELRNYATGRLVAAYTYSPWDLLSRWVKRNRAAFVTALLGVLLLAGVGVASYRSILEERDRAEAALADYILESAREARSRDPTLAAARLKRLDRPLEGAASVAASAEERGVARRVLIGHQDQVHAVAFSPDGKQLASGSHDYSVRLWDLASGTGRIVSGHEERVTSLAFSPDGAYLVSGGYDHRVLVVEVESLEVRELAGHAHPVKAVTFSPDGSLLAAVSEGAVIVWDALTFEEKMTADIAGDRYLAAAFTPGGEALATGSHNRAIRVWDVGTFDSIRLEGHRRMVTSLAFAPDGELLVSSSADGTVRLWNRRTGQSRVIVEHPGEAMAVAFSPDGAWVASGGNDDLIRVWSRKDRSVRTLAGHEGDITALRFADDGALISSSWDNTARVWRAETGDLVATLLGHRDVVSALATSGEYLATASWDKEVRVWSIGAAAHHRVWRGHLSGVHGVDTYGPWVASGAHDDMVRVWNTRTGESVVLAGHTDHVYRVLFSPDGRFIASSSDDRTVRLWSTETWEGRVLQGHEADVEELAFSPDGRWLASASEDDTIRVWDVGTAAEARVLRGHEHDVTDVSFSADGRHLASSSKDATVRWWSLADGSAQVFAGHNAEVDGVDVAPREDLVASASEDGTVRLWWPHSGKQEVVGRLSLPWRVRFSPDSKRLGVAGLGADVWVCEVHGECRHFSGHTGRVWDLEFSPDGQALVTGSADATVRIWDIATGENRELLGHRESVFDVAVTRDGKTIASASSDNTVRTWRLRLPPPQEGLTEWLDELTDFTTSLAATRNHGGSRARPGE